MSEALKITFLGTGTSQGVPVVACDCEVCRSEDDKDKRLRSSVLLQAGGKSIIIDAGPDFRQQMLRIKQHQLDAVLLTHEHVDHMYGLDDIRAFNWVQQSAVPIYAEERVLGELKRVYSYVFADYRFGGLPEMELHEIQHSSFAVNDILFTPIRGLHYKLPVFGYRVGDFAYLTDMNCISDDEKQKLHHLDVLVLGAVHKKKHISHMNLEEALQLIVELQPKQAYITHISHYMGLHQEEDVQLPPHVHLAYDGLVVSAGLP
ncbi:MAG: MBL fold metallo-hydrolase [Mangrovibacterium sp.]